MRSVIEGIQLPLTDCGPLLVNTASSVHVSLPRLAIRCYTLTVQAIVLRILGDSELRRRHTSIDAIVECLGETLNKSFSGRLLTRISPELHGLVKLAGSISGKYMPGSPKR